MREISLPWCSTLAAYANWAIVYLEPWRERSISTRLKEVLLTCSPSLFIHLWVHFLTSWNKWRHIGRVQYWSDYCISYNFHVTDIFTVLDWVQKFTRTKFHDFSDVFITINRHKLKWKFSQGLTREIRENKTTVNITMYTVSFTIVQVLQYILVHITQGYY